MRLAPGKLLVIGVASSKALWYLTRGTGVVALLLLTTVVILGILNAVRWSPRGQPRFVLQRVHRNASLLAVMFIVVHVVTTVIDAFAPIRWIDAVVPFVSAYRPIWLGLGAVAFDLVIAIVVTSLFRAWIGYPVWRIVHWLSYAMWPVAVFHGLGIGSDSKQPWMLALVMACVAGVIAAVAWRLVADGWQGRAAGRTGMAVGAVSMPFVLGVWLLSGPLQPGWASRSGTPATLLPSSRSIAASPKAVASTPAQIVLPARASGSGTTRLHRLPGGLARVVIDLTTTGGEPLGIRVVLNGQPVGQGISMSNGTAVLTPPNGTVPYQGTVTALSGGNVSTQLSDGHGDEIGLDLSLAISPGGATTCQVAIHAIAGQP